MQVEIRAQDCQTFTVDNTPPTISGSLSPNGLYAGKNMDVEAYTSQDAQTVTASFGSEQKTLKDTSTAAWSGSYTPSTTTVAGDYQMHIQTSDILGNTATMTLPYTIYPAGEPNTPTQPTIPDTHGNPTSPQAPNNSNGATGGGSGVAQGSASNGGGLSPSGKSGDESQHKFPPTEKPEEPNKQDQFEKAYDIYSFIDDISTILFLIALLILIIQFGGFATWPALIILGIGAALVIGLILYTNSTRPSELIKKLFRLK